MEFLDFLNKNKEVDIFCFQEVYHNAHEKNPDIWEGANFDLLNDLIKALPEYNYYYHPHLDDFWGLALFIKKEYAVKDHGEVFVHKYKNHDYGKERLGYTAKNIQYITLENASNDILTVINFHGLWNGQGNTEERLLQSQKIIDFLSTRNGDVVLCGDFNLTPDTESIALLERAGLRNLITEHGITSTRTSFYKKAERFADYVFVSPSLSITSFGVMPDEVSDHSAMKVVVEL